MLNKQYKINNFRNRIIKTSVFVQFVALIGQKRVAAGAENTALLGAESLGTHACSFLEIFAEGRLCGEIEFVGYFLNGEVGVRKHDAGLGNHIFANPVNGPLAAVLFYYARYILGCEIHFVSIKGKAALP